VQREERLYLAAQRRDSRRDLVETLLELPAHPDGLLIDRGNRGRAPGPDLAVELDRLQHRGQVELLRQRLQ